MKYKVIRRVEVDYCPDKTLERQARETVLRTVHLVRDIPRRKGDQNIEKEHDT